MPDEALHWQGVYLEAQSLANGYNKAAEMAKNHLRRIIGNNAVGLLPDESGGWTRKIVKRSGYTVEPSEYIDFRFSKKPKGIKK